MKPTLTKQTPALFDFYSSIKYKVFKPTFFFFFFLLLLFAQIIHVARWIYYTLQNNTFTVNKEILSIPIP